MEKDAPGECRGDLPDGQDVVEAGEVYESRYEECRLDHRGERERPFWREEQCGLCEREERGAGGLRAELEE